MSLSILRMTTKQDSLKWGRRCFKCRHISFLAVNKKQHIPSTGPMTFWSLNSGNREKSNCNHCLKDSLKDGQSMFQIHYYRQESRVIWAKEQIAILLNKLFQASFPEVEIWHALQKVNATTFTTEKMSFRCPLPACLFLDTL